MQAATIEEVPEENDPLDTYLPVDPEYLTYLLRADKGKGRASAGPSPHPSAQPPAGFSIRTCTLTTPGPIRTTWSIRPS
jgi:hypothetical protein